MTGPRAITRGAAGAALVVVASSLYACSKSTPSTAASCSSLALCCPSIPADEQVTCTAVAGQDNDSSCSTLLSTYAASGACSIHVTNDSGPSRADASASCTLLSLCCPNLSAADQGTCNATATEGVPTLCTTALSGYQDLGQCGGVSQDSGTSTFSGPSCPPGKPPDSLVGADAGVDCLKCVGNCTLTNDLTASCAAYYDCFCPCAAGDTGCQQACSPLAGDCPDTVTSVQSCVASDCLSLCPQSGSGITTCQGDAGAQASAACSTCLTGDCGAELTGYQSDCASYASCVSGCTCGDSSCEDACESAASSACQADLMGLGNCLLEHCVSQCETGAG